MTFRPATRSGHPESANALLRAADSLLRAERSKDLSTFRPRASTLQSLRSTAFLLLPGSAKSFGTVVSPFILVRCYA